MNYLLPQSISFSRINKLKPYPITGRYQIRQISAPLGLCQDAGNDFPDVTTLLQITQLIFFFLMLGRMSEVSRKYNVTLSIYSP